MELGDDQGAFEEAERGLAVKPMYPQLYIAGAAAAQRLGALAQARDWVAVLRGRTAFISLAAVRRRMVRAHEPAALGQFERLINCCAMPTCRRIDQSSVRTVFVAASTRLTLAHCDLHASKG